jgi:hypothetical protein
MVYQKPQGRPEFVMLIRSMGDSREAKYFINLLYATWQGVTLALFKRSQGLRTASLTICSVLEHFFFIEKDL